MEDVHLTIPGSPMSPPASPFPSQAFVFPEHPLTETTKEKNCSLDDVLRYIGIVGSLAGVVWAFAFQPNATAGGILFTITGSVFFIGHITDKTCGAKARVIKVAKAKLESFRATLQSAEQTVQALKKLSAKWKSDTDLFEVQKRAMAEETLKLQQAIESLKTTVETQQQENGRLQDISTALQQKTATQATQIATLNEQIREITAQNQQVLRGLEQMEETLPKVKKTGKNLSATVTQTTAELKKNLGAFSQQIMEKLVGINQFLAEMSAEHAEMKHTITQLKNQTTVIHTTTGELGQHLQTLTQAQEVETGIQQQMNLLADRLSADKKALQATQERIKNTLRRNKSEEKKGEL